MHACFPTLALSVSLLQQGRACPLSASPAEAADGSPAAAVHNPHVHSTAPTRSEVLNTQVKPEEALMISSLAWSAVRATKEPRRDFHACTAFLPQVSGCARSPCPSHSLLFVPRVGTHGGWWQHFEPTSHWLRQAVCTQHSAPGPGCYQWPAVHGKEGLLLHCRAFHFAFSFSRLLR